MLVQMDVRSILSATFRQIWKFILVFVPIFLIGLIYVLSATKYYESTAQMLIKFGEDARPEVSITSRGNALSAEEKRGLVQANLNILRSRDVAIEVFKNLDPVTIYPELKKKKRSAELQQEFAIGMLAKSIETSTESNAGSINVSVFHPKAETAQQILTTLIDVFLIKQAEIFGNPQIEVLREQSQASRKRLDDATVALNDYKNSKGIASIDEELTILLEQRGNIVNYLLRRQETVPTGIATASSADGSESVVGEETDNTNKEKPTVVTSLPAQVNIPGDSSRFPLIDDSQNKIDALRSEEASLLLTYKQDSERVKNIRKNIASEKAALDRSLAAMNEQVEELDRQISEKQEFRVEYDELLREVTYSDEAFKTAQERLHASEINNDLNQRKITRVSLIEEPTKPMRPSRPNKMLIMALCLIVGATFGAALGLGTEILDSTFSRPEQLQAELKLPVLASFKDYAARPKKQWELPKSVLMNETVAKYIHAKPVMAINTPPTTENMGFISKELAGLYQSIARALPAGQSRIINFSSTHKGEGATRIAYEIAKLAATQTDQNVLFIGSENFLPAGSPLPPRAAASLIDVAAGRAPLRDALVSVDSPAGRLSHACIQKKQGIEHLIGGIDKLGDVLKELRSTYALIVIPTPDIISNPLSAILSQSYDGIVFVVEAEKTRAPVAKQALLALSSSGEKVLGLVLNKQRHYIPDWLYTRL